MHKTSKAADSSASGRARQWSLYTDYSLNRVTFVFSIEFDVLTFISGTFLCVPFSEKAGSSASNGQDKTFRHRTGTANF